MMSDYEQEKTETTETSILCVLRFLLLKKSA